MWDTSILVKYLGATTRTIAIAANVPIGAVVVVAMYFCLNCTYVSKMYLYNKTFYGLN